MLMGSGAASRHRTKDEHGRFLTKSARQEDQFKETTNDQYYI